MSTKYGLGWYADFYTFTGAAGDWISISLSAVCTSRMVLYDPNGLEAQYESVRMPEGSGYYTLPMTGWYTLRGDHILCRSHGKLYFDHIKL